MRQVLQICPHDVPPFAALCASYEDAARRTGASVQTVILGRPHGAPNPAFVYLGIEQLQRTRALGAALRGVLESVAPDVRKRHDQTLVLCHRYRSARAAMAAGVPAAKIVLLAHEFGLFDSLSRRLHRRLFAPGLRVAGVSPAVAADASGRALDDERLLVLPNVIDPVAPGISRAEARAELGLAPDATLIGVVGRLHYKKRPLLACDALQVVRATQPDIGLAFVGSGPLRGAIEALQLPGVHLCGEVPDAARHMSAFDVLLHCGDVEAFGMVVLEAMAAGVPVVTGPREVCAGPAYVMDELGFYAGQDSPHGYAVALGEALASDADYMVRAQQRARARFSVAALAECLQRLLPDEG